MVNISTEIIKVIRPIHWIKNFALFAALIFSGGLLSVPLFLKVSWGFVIFSLATSATYTFNDILDAKLDRLHPVKKYRPIASGTLSPSIAMTTAFVLAFFALFLSFSLNRLFFFAILGYLLIQAGYSLGLKNIAILDILIIATGFILRVYAGAFVIDAHLSVWFLLCVISTALFLASGKRRAELNVLESVKGITRKSLVRYKTELLDSFVTMFGNAAWLSWALFTFFESPRASLPVWLFLAEISRTTTVDKLLMASTPVVIFGIMRYESLIFGGESEAPEKLLLTDKPLILSIVIWLSIVVWILYGGVSVYGL